MPGKREALAKVLVIDDEEAVRALARHMLESRNHTIIEAATAESPKPFTAEQLLSLIDDLPSHTAPEKAAP